MRSDRRHFLKTAGVSVTALAASASVLHAAEPSPSPQAGVAECEALLDDVEQPPQETWDISWAKRVTGKHKAMFDVPEIEGGVGIFRAGIWGQQYTDVLKLSPGDLSTVIVIRHAAIPLAMNNDFWATYGLGKSLKIRDDKGKKWTTVNPMLSTPSTDPKSSTSNYLLDKQIAKGAIALGCNLAFRQMVSIVAKQDKLSPAAAREKAKTFLVPGLIMQPSGIFANVMAEEAGCVFVNAV
ncbi:MAG: twin-arginine translocation signal domain-containing protein [Gemmatimonadota bacterium]|nr:twin-arginine translocation signal domain-containing protein [Gemmatimonadota bacterium]